jgi:hypothetical protein
VVFVIVWCLSGLVLRKRWNGLSRFFHVNSRVFHINTSLSAARRRGSSVWACGLRGRSDRASFAHQSMDYASQASCFNIGGTHIHLDLHTHSNTRRYCFSFPDRCALRYMYVVCTEACSCISRRTCAANSSAHPCVAHSALPMSCKWKAVVLPYPLRRYIRIRRCRQVRVRCVVSGKRSHFAVTWSALKHDFNHPRFNITSHSFEHFNLSLIIAPETAMHLIVIRYFMSLWQLEPEVSGRTGGRASPSHRKDCTQWHGTCCEPTSPIPSSRDTSVGSYV